MVKDEEEIVQTTKYHHKMYCDKCGEFIGELDIMGLPDYHQRRIYVKIPIEITDTTGKRCRSRYRTCALHKDLCDKCYTELTDKIVDSLVSLGFDDMDKAVEKELRIDG